MKVLKPAWTAWVALCTVPLFLNITSLLDQDPLKYIININHSVHPLVGIGTPPFPWVLGHIKKLRNFPVSSGDYKRYNTTTHSKQSQTIKYKYHRSKKTFYSTRQPILRVKPHRGAANILGVTSPDGVGILGYLPNGVGDNGELHGPVHYLQVAQGVGASLLAHSSWGHSIQYSTFQNIK